MRGCRRKLPCEILSDLFPVQRMHADQPFPSVIESKSSLVTSAPLGDFSAVPSFHFSLCEASARNLEWLTFVFSTSCAVVAYLRKAFQLVRDRLGSGYTSLGGIRERAECDIWDHSRFVTVRQEDKSIRDVSMTNLKFVQEGRDEELTCGLASHLVSREQPGSSLQTFHSCTVMTSLCYSSPSVP